VAATGIALLAVGSIGICGAVALEVKYHDPIYKLLMKIFPWLIALGSMLLAVGLGGG